MLFNRLTRNLEIVHCPLTEVTSPPACDVYLLEIDDPKSALDLRALLPDWFGWELNLENCAGFNDSVFRILRATPMDRETRGEMLYVPALVSSKNKNCKGRSASALRTME